MNIEMLIFLAVVFTVFSVCYTVSYCCFVKKESTFRICDALETCCKILRGMRKNGLQDR